jgi:hypothetical protein
VYELPAQYPNQSKLKQWIVSIMRFFVTTMTLGNCQAISPAMHDFITKPMQFAASLPHKELRRNIDIEPLVDAIIDILTGDFGGVIDFQSENLEDFDRFTGFQLEKLGEF